MTKDEAATVRPGSVVLFGWSRKVVHGVRADGPNPPYFTTVGAGELSHRAYRLPDDPATRASNERHRARYDAAHGITHSASAR